MSNSNRKCFSFIPSSFVSIYMITAFFTISFLSLLYLKYPQQYINHFEYLRIVNLTPTTKEATTPLSVNDFTTPSVSLLKEEIVVNPESNPATAPLLSDSQFPPDSVVENPAPNSTFGQEEKDDQVQPPTIVEIPSSLNPTPEVVQDKKDEQISPSPVVEIPSQNLTAEEVQEEKKIEKISETPVVDSPLNDAPVNSSVSPEASVVEEAKIEKNDQTQSASPPEAVIQTEKKQEEAEEDEDDESIVASIDQYDHLSNPPYSNSSEERMQWIKLRLPGSKVLESTPKTRMFEEKLQHYISEKRCRVNIFMTWISSAKFFGKREMFSLESVVKAHPGGCVFIVSRIMASKPGREMIQPLIERGHLILPIAPDFNLLFSGTPANDWLRRLKDGKMDPGKIPIAQNLSNLLRLVILYKYGGVYLDTDMIILKDVSGLRNTIGVQELDEKKKVWVSVNNAVLIFDKQHPLLLRFLEEFNSTFDGSLWGHNGPYMATRVIKSTVDDSRYQFNMMSPMAFYPVDWYKIYKLFRNSTGKRDSEWVTNTYNKIIRESYGVHLWNKMTRNLKIEKDGAIGKIISTYCIICNQVYSS
ncbi:uncharacterized protein At4g19900-like [Chenopodium quinoa]|uniref:uncharacterized protein At4g19900-like n=1 Tax=Chenopodium quinoa TaxID=63459 RepID=UPI000B78B308|nr:uncharacterized protein At4g19900-like [Chenopodium quinoa]